MRSIQTEHIEVQKMDDIAFNFLIGGNGIIYNGRGWNAVGRHTKNFNSNSICIALIGIFNYEAPHPIQLDAIQRLIDEGIRLNKITNDYRLYGQRQLIPSTNSPGQKLYDIITTWMHWSSEIK